MKRDIDNLIALAKEVEVTDPIDWSVVPNLNRDDAYFLIATRLYEMMINTREEERVTVLLASLVKLSVENFVLNLSNERY